jgi:Holliday junction resolvase RusA-like endonuclease
MQIHIPGDPIAKKRPRFFTKKNMAGIRKYNPQETEEGKVFMMCKNQVTHCFDEPIAVDFTFKIRRPKSHFGTGRNAKTVKPSSPGSPGGVPDLDNYIKFYSDVLNTVAWRDDSLICRIAASKEYADEPETIIMVDKFGS